MDFDLAYDYESFFTKDPTLKKSDIEELKKWVQDLDSNTTIPKNITDKQLLVFHLACLRVTKDTKKCIKTHYDLRDNHPEQFDNRDPDAKIMVEAREAQEYIYMPVTTDEGYGVTLHRLHDFRVERYNYGAGCKWNHMMYESLINERGPFNGIILLFDFRGSKLGHLTRISIGYLSKFMEYLQEGLNGRIEVCHLLNVGPVFDMALKLLQPFVKGEKLMKKIVVHKSNMDWEEFYKNAVPKKYLPSDFGGDLPDTQTINKANIDRVCRNKAFLEGEEKQRNLYSKNKKKKSTTQTKFPSLDID